MGSSERLFSVGREEVLAWCMWVLTYLLLKLLVFVRDDTVLIRSQLGLVMSLLVVSMGL